MKSTTKRRSWLLPVGALAAVLVSGPALSAAITFQYSTSFGAVPPVGGAPYATATFDDQGSVGTVDLNVVIAGTVGGADVTGMYFNLNPLMDPTALTITHTGGTGPAPNNIFTGTDQFQADGDGFYDILIDLPPPPGNQRFEATENLTFAIAGAGITASSFNWLSAPGPGSTAGPFASVLRFQSTGIDEEGSDWIAGDDPLIPPSAIPIPAAAWLFGSALLGLIGVARRKKA